AMMLSDIVRDHRVIICVGSGGVGKTTTSAAIALWGALAGRRAVVLTIDPAVFTREGLRARGELFAMMLDQKGAWDRLVARHAPSDEIRERILKNRFY